MRHGSSLLTLLVIAGCEGPPETIEARAPVAVAAPATLSGGWQHSCAIEGTTLRCWGLGNVGQLGDGGSEVAQGTPVTVPGAWRAVAAGTTHTCGIQTDGTLWCWGRNYVGQLGTGDRGARPEPVRVGDGEDWTYVAVGGGHSCGLHDDGRLDCWGGADLGQADDQPPPPHTLVPTAVPGRWRQVGAHFYRVCALADDASLWCWSPPESAPHQVDAGPFRTLAVGVRLVCAVRDDGALWCWDDEDQGARIGGDAAFSDAPGALTVSYHVCARGRDDSLWCGGRNDRGQLGIGERTPDTPDLEPVAGAGWLEVAAGAAHTCARDAAGTWCWGSNAFGQLGDGSDAVVETPALVDAGPGWTSPTLGAFHACALRDGELRCWGAGARSGALAVDPPTDAQVPVAATVAASPPWTQVASASFSSCGVRADHTLWCWGAAAFDPNALVAKQIVSPAGTWAGVSRGDGGPCAWRADGKVFCWPDEYQGSYTPDLVTGGVALVLVVGSDRHHCGLDASGALHCWGDNADGQLGLGAGAPAATTPTRVGTDTWLTVSAFDHGLAGTTCAVRADHTLWCWGANPDGRRGDGDPAPRPAPVRVGDAADWARVDGGARHACAIKLDGSLWCWGSGVDGQLGTGTLSPAPLAPTRVGEDADWVEVDASLAHTCATRTDGSLWCWGQGSDGQVGHGHAWALAPQRTL